MRKCANISPYIRSVYIQYSSRSAKRSVTVTFPFWRTACENLLEETLGSMLVTAHSWNMSPDMERRGRGWGGGGWNKVLIKKLPGKHFCLPPQQEAEAHLAGFWSYNLWKIWINSIIIWFCSSFPGFLCVNANVKETVAWRGFSTSPSSYLWMMTFKGFKIYFFW